MAKHQKRLIASGLGVIVLLIGLFLGGTGVTVYAAQAALPGDTLYPVKTSLEHTRVSMAGDAVERAELHMAFAERRLQEIAGLIEEQRFQNFSSATQAFDTSISQVIEDVDLVTQNDPDQAAVLMAQVSELLSRYSRTLSSMLGSVPEPVRQEILQEIETSSADDNLGTITTSREFTGEIEAITQGAWIIGGKTVFIQTQTEIKGSFLPGDIVKVHVLLNGDGDLVAREIEIAGEEDLTDNTNGQDDDLGNGNENENDNRDDDRGQDNANLNDNMNAENDTNSNEDDSNDNNDEYYDDYFDDRQDINGNTNTNVTPNTDEDNNSVDNGNENSNSGDQADDGDDQDDQNENDRSGRDDHNENGDDSNHNGDD